jgi:RNA polymerase sigma-70 factor (ECF subfamily)
MEAATQTPVDPPALPAGFHRLFEQEVSYVSNTLRRLGVQPADLDDLTHEVFLAVHRRWDDYDPSRPPRPWLCAFAYRAASSYRRGLRQRREVPGEAYEIADDAPTADDGVASAEARKLVMQALDTLDLDRRVVLVMHDIDETSAPDIARELSVPLNTVYSRLRQARADFEAAVRRLRLRRGER